MLLRRRRFIFIPLKVIFTHLLSPLVGAQTHTHTHTPLLYPYKYIQSIYDTAGSLRVDRETKSLSIDSTSSTTAGRPTSVSPLSVCLSVQSPIDMTQQQSYSLSTSLPLSPPLSLCCPCSSALLLWVPFCVLIKYLRAWPLFLTKATANT